MNIISSAQIRSLFRCIDRHRYPEFRELLLLLWLVIKGVNVQAWEKHTQEAV